MGHEFIDVLSDTEKGCVVLCRNGDTNDYIIVRTLNYINDTYEKLIGIRHPYMPEIYDVEYRDGQTIVYEEYIKGISIADAELSEAKIYKAMRELCFVVMYLHKLNILHRDIKPSNILYAADKHIRLIDFEASRSVKENQSTDTRYLGTHGYAAPEQFGFSQTGPRTDIYAIGKTLEKLLGKDAKKWRNARIIKKCTMLDPKKRYKNAFLLWLKMARMEYEPVFAGVRSLIWTGVKVFIVFFIIGLIVTMNR